MIQNHIAIGTDDQPVNMDLWNPTLLDDSIYSLGSITGNYYSTINAYQGEFIDGRIQGKVPQYIYNESTLKFESVTKMQATFNINGSGNSLIYPPELPTTVYDIQGVFAMSYNLTIAPKIPDGVKNMAYTFIYCRELEGKIVMPSSVTNLYYTFSWWKK